jgi:ferredoxin
MLSSLKQSLGRATGAENSAADLKKFRDLLTSVEERVRELAGDLRLLRDELGGLRELRTEVQSLREEVAELRRTSGSGGAGPAPAGGARSGSSALDQSSLASVSADEQRPEVADEPEPPPEAAADEMVDSPVSLSEVAGIVEALADVVLSPAGAASPPPAAVERPVSAAPPEEKAPSLADAVRLALQGGRMVHADTGSTDLAAYAARARAAGRSLQSLSGGEGLNIAPDGVAYWGPVDNESSRAKAAKRVLTVDQVECIACGTCVEQTDKVFYLPDGDKATPIAQDGPMDLIQDAIDECPVTCIHWVPPEEAEARGLATGEDYALP